MNFLLSAGEASGDTYGAQLIDRLLELSPGSTFFGMGGEKMRAADAELLVHANEVAVVGLVEVVTHLPGIRRRFKHLVAEAARRKPDAAILIDFPTSTCAWRANCTAWAFQFFTLSAHKSGPGVPAA